MGDEHWMPSAACSHTSPSPAGAHANCERHRQIFGKVLHCLTAREAVLQPTLLSCLASGKCLISSPASGRNREQLFLLWPEQRSRRISSVPFPSGRTEPNAHLDQCLLPEQLTREHAGKWLGNIKMTRDILSWRSDCSLLFVYICMYSLMAFWILCPWSKGKHGFGSAAGFRLAHVESRKRNLSSKTPPRDAMPYIITAFSFPKTLIPPVNAHSLSPRQIIPQSFGGLAELRAKLQSLLESTLGFYKPAYPEEA